MGEGWGEVHKKTIYRGGIKEGAQKIYRFKEGFGKKEGSGVFEGRGEIL